MNLDPCGRQFLQQPPQMMVSISFASFQERVAAMISFESTSIVTNPTCVDIAEQPGIAKSAVFRQQGGFQQMQGSQLLCIRQTD